MKLLVAFEYQIKRRRNTLARQGLALLSVIKYGFLFCSWDITTTRKERKKIVNGGAHTAADVDVPRMPRMSKLLSDSTLAVSE